MLNIKAGVEVKEGLFPFATSEIVYGYGASTEKCVIKPATQARDAEIIEFIRMHPGMERKLVAVVFHVSYWRVCHAIRRDGDRRRVPRDTPDRRAT